MHISPQDELFKETITTNKKVWHRPTNTMDTAHFRKGSIDGIDMG